MTCTHGREQLALYVNKDATAEEREATEEHLCRCADCRRIVAQYQSAAGQLAKTLPDVKPVRQFIRRSTHRRLRLVAAAAALVLALVGAMQVPVVAAKVAKVFPFLQVFELDKIGVAKLIRGFSEDSVRKVYSPHLYQTLEEAEQAWGGKIPQPTALPAGMDLYRIEMFRWESGHKDVYFRYRNSQAGGNLTIHLATRPQQRMVPSGVTSETTVNGQKAVVISGTWGQYPGKPLQWEPDSDIHVFFPLGELHGEVSTAGQQPGISVSELVNVAESMR